MNNNIDGVGGSDTPETPENPESPESNVNGSAADKVDETGGESTAEVQGEAANINNAKELPTEGELSDVGEDDSNESSDDKSPEKGQVKNDYSGSDEGSAQSGYEDINPSIKLDEDDEVNDSGEGDTKSSNDEYDNKTLEDIQPDLEENAEDASGSEQDVDNDAGETEDEQKDPTEDELNQPVDDAGHELDGQQEDAGDNGSDNPEEKTEDNANDAGSEQNGDTQESATENPDKDKKDDSGDDSGNDSGEGGVLQHPGYKDVTSKADDTDASTINEAKEQDLDDSDSQGKQDRERAKEEVHRVEVENNEDALDQDKNKPENDKLNIINKISEDISNTDDNSAGPQNKDLDKSNTPIEKSQLNKTDDVSGHVENAEQEQTKDNQNIEKKIISGEAKDAKLKTPANSIKKNVKAIGKTKASDASNIEDGEQKSKDVQSVEKKNEEINEAGIEEPQLRLRGPKETPNNRDYVRSNETREANKQDVKEKLAAVFKAPIEILQNILRGQRRSSNRFQNKRRYRDEREIKASETNVNDLRAKIQRLNDFKNANWDKLSEKEKNEIETIIGNLTSVIGKELDLKEMPKLETYHANDDSVYGAYDSKNNIIYLNTTHLTDGMETIDTLAHEMRHAWQNNSTSDKAERFKSDLEHPKNPTINYEAYKEQASEQDAREYATQFCDQVEESTPKLEDLNYETSKVQPVYHTEAHEIEKNLDYKRNDIDEVKSIDDRIDDFTEVIDKAIEKANGDPEKLKNIDNYHAFNDLLKKQDRAIFKDVDLNNSKDVKNRLKQAIDARQYIFDKLCKNEDKAKYYLKDLNIVNDPNAVDIDKLKDSLEKTKIISSILKDINNLENKGKTVKDLGSWEALSKLDIYENGINNFDDLKKAIEDKNQINISVKWESRTDAPEGLDKNKNIETLFGSMPEVVYRQGASNGNNLTGLRGATSRDTATPYIDNKYAKHTYRRGSWKEYKKIIDVVKKYSLKYKDLDNNDFQNKARIREIVKKEIEELSPKNIAPKNRLTVEAMNEINGDYKAFQKRVKEEGISCDSTYGLAGEVAALKNIDKKKYSGGASQYNTPVPILLLTYTGWLKENE